MLDFKTIKQIIDKSDNSEKGSHDKTNRTAALGSLYMGLRICGTECRFRPYEAVCVQCIQEYHSIFILVYYGACF